MGKDYGLLSRTGDRGETSELSAPVQEWSLGAFQNITYFTLRGKFQKKAKIHNAIFFTTP